jgi:hypothetical protein
MPTLTLTRQQFEGVRERAFKAFLEARGAELLEPTNQWELLRFRTEEGTSIIYTDKRGKLTWTNQAAEAYLACIGNKAWRAVPKTQRRKKSSVVCQALRERDGHACFFCHLDVPVEEESAEHLVPVTAGGPDHIANMALAHQLCNQQAGHASLMVKIAIRESNWRRPHTPGTLPHLLLPPDAAEAVKAIAVAAAEDEAIDDLFDRGEWPAVIISTPTITGVVQLDRLEMLDAKLGDYVWLEGRYGDLEIPKTRGQVIAADEQSVTVSLPPWSE